MDTKKCISIGSYRGIEKFFSTHAKEQFDDRLGDSYKDSLQIVFNNTLDRVIDEYGLTGSVVYVTHSQSTDIGLVIRVERKKAKICTVLPIKKIHHATEDGDVAIVVEKDARALSGKKKMQEATQEGMVHLVRLYEDEVIVTFWEGKLYDIDCEFILVD